MLCESKSFLFSVHKGRVVTDWTCIQFSGLSVRQTWSPLGFTPCRPVQCFFSGRGGIISRIQFCFSWMIWKLNVVSCGLHLLCFKLHWKEKLPSLEMLCLPFFLISLLSDKFVLFFNSPWNVCRHFSLSPAHQERWSASLFLPYRIFISQRCCLWSEPLLFDRRETHVPVHKVDVLSFRPALSFSAPCAIFPALHRLPHLFHQPSFLCVKWTHS